MGEGERVEGGGVKISQLSLKPRLFFSAVLFWSVAAGDGKVGTALSVLAHSLPAHSLSAKIMGTDCARKNNPVSPEAIALFLLSLRWGDAPTGQDIGLSKPDDELIMSTGSVFLCVNK